MKIDSLQTLQKFTNVSNEFSFETLASFEDTSFHKYLKNWFNDSLLNQVFGYSTSNIQSEESKAYEMLMYAHVSFTMLEYSFQGEVIISDIGFVRSENENTKTAYAQQMKMYRSSQEDNAFLFTNQLIDLFDLNPTLFSEWLLSPGYENRTSLLVKSAKEFNAIQRLYRMNTTFIEIIPSIKEAQDLHLITFFGESFINELNVPTGLSAHQLVIKGYLVTALVNISMAISMRKGLVKLSTSGVIVISNDADSSNKIENVAMPERISSSFKSYMDTGKRYIDLAYKHAVASNLLIQESYNPKRFWA